MSKARDEYLDKMFGVTGVADILKEGPQKLEEALTAKGVQHKSADVPDPAAQTQEAESTFAALLLQMIESQADTMKEFDDLKALVTTDQETRLKEKAAFDDRYQELETENKELREAMKLSPRHTLTGEAKKEAETEIEERTQPTASDDLVERLRRQLAEGS